jgi:hypothetical protein
MQIPESVRRLLWEYDLGADAPGEAWERAVLERVMQVGGWNEMRWLMRTFSRDRLRSFLEQRGRRSLGPRELRFWLTLCEIPSATGNEWVALARERDSAWRG